MIILRWTLLLLLLANVMLFFWFSMQQRAAQQAAAQNGDLQRIKLLTELSRSELKKRQSEAAESAGHGLAEGCFDVAGFRSEAEAMQLYRLLQSAGVPALVASYRIELPQRYLLVLRTSESTIERLRLLDYLQRHGLPLLETDMSGLDSVLAVYHQRRDAERARELLALLQMIAEVREEDPYQLAYRIQFHAPVDENLSNKIKEIVNSSHVGLNFAKKVCAGVESLRRTE